MFGRREISTLGRLQARVVHISFNGMASLQKGARQALVHGLEGQVFSRPVFPLQIEVIVQRRQAVYFPVSQQLDSA